MLDMGLLWQNERGNSNDIGRLAQSGEISSRQRETESGRVNHHPCRRACNTARVASAVATRRIWVRGSGASATHLQVKFVSVDAVRDGK